MATIDTSSWKEFKLSDLFDIEDTWIYGKNKQYVNKYEEKINNSIAVVSGVTVNNGVNYYTDDKVEESEIYCDCLTISTRGEYSGSVFYHDYPFVLANNILVMPMPNISKEAKLFIGSVIQKLPFGGYANYPTKDKLKECIIKLPVKEVEEIDFEYMEKYIAELEGQRIAELEGYLVATGLNDYVLTEEDKQILYLSTETKFNEDSNNENRLQIRKFKLDDLFVKKTMKGYPKTAEDMTENKNGYPVYGQNIQWKYSYKLLLDEKYLHKVDPDYPILAYTSSVGEIGMIDEAFYRSGDNGAFQGLFPKHYRFNKYQLNYLLSVLKKHFDNFGYSTSMANIMELDFYLPIKVENNSIVIDEEHKYHKEGYIPDFEFMEKYIRVIEKLVITDVVKYKDEIIEKTKEILST